MPDAFVQDDDAIEYEPALTVGPAYVMFIYGTPLVVAAEILAGQVIIGGFLPQNMSKLQFEKSPALSVALHFTVAFCPDGIVV